MSVEYCNNPCFCLSELMCNYCFLAGIVNGFFSNAIPMLMKWVKSLKATTKTGNNRSLAGCFSVS